MLKTPSVQRQLESLRKTTSTKEQVLQQIESATFDQLKAIVPEVAHFPDKKEIQEEAERLLNADKFPVDIHPVTEAIVKRFGRPVCFIKDGIPELKGEEIQKFKGLVDNAMSSLNLGASIRSVGRIELNNHPDYLWVGTGWLFAKNLLMTNRHVAEIFVESNIDSFRFQRFLGSEVVPRVDFLAEFGNEKPAEFAVKECVYIGSGELEDIAILRVSLDGEDYAPLPIFGGPLREREDIAVIGYPAFDSRVNLVDDMRRIYQDVYDVKRLAPGKIAKVESERGFLIHDATTLGGNSGSVVLSLETGEVVGLHFSGQESFGNYCVDAPTLLRVIKSLSQSKLFSFQPATKPPEVSFSSLALETNKACKLQEYTSIKVPSFDITGRIHAFASPDSTYFITKKLFRAAKKSILIGIYDFTAEHIYSCIIDAIDRGVSVSLMLDLEGEKETQMFKKLKKDGVECVPAPACTSQNARYFASSHEKVIVIDNKWTIVQSGNYSNNSCPFNELDGDASEGFKTGNRDMGIAIESAPLARFFTGVLKSDMKLQLTAPHLEGFVSPALDKDFLIEAPKRMPDPLFPSRLFNPDDAIEIQPVLSPDNYMDVVEAWLKTAKKSIRIEQQYIRVNQPNIQRLLKAIPDGVKVQIIIARPIGADNVPKTMNEMSTLENTYGFDVRLLSKQFVHCHNKLIVVDGSSVLISSQNWSDFAVTKNREAGVIVYDKEIAKYYQKIFDADWTMSDEPIEEAVSLSPVLNLEAFGAQPGRFVRIDAGDVQEV